MASIQLLTLDLNNLSLETKRRNHDIRTACDLAVKNLSNFSNIDQINHNEIKQSLLNPILLSCKSDNLKLITISIPIIQKLILTRLIPVDSLSDLLDSFSEASNLAMDIQLRILQNLPSLLTNYNQEFTDDLILRLLGLCINLTSNNKSTVVINTASATLQQLFTNIFDRTDNLPANIDIKIDNQMIQVSKSDFEKFQIFQDLVLMLNNQSTNFFNQLVHLKKLSILEIIENIIINHKKLFYQNRELGYLLRHDLVPSLLNLLNEQKDGTENFPIVIRSMRIILVLLSSQLANLEIECEILLSFLNHFLLDNTLKSTNKINWKRILVLEIYKMLFSDFKNIKEIFMIYDKNPSKKNVFQELTFILLNYIQNNPILVQSKVGPIALPQPAKEGNTVIDPPIYLSKSTSNMKISILDHLDKSDPPSLIPETYPIYLTFEIILAYSNGIAKFVQHLSDSNTVNDHKDDNGRLTSHNLELDIEFSNSFIESSFPNISVLFENFIYSRLDNECFHLLIHAYQRFTHTIGLLGLSELRDSLLLILSKAITTNDSNNHSSQTSSSTSYLEQGKQLLAYGEAFVESITGNEQQASKSNKREVTLHSRSFNSRQIVCLRALSNLASSLGSTLLDSWKIIWITFQWVNYFIEGPDEQSSYFNNKQFKSFPKDMMPKLGQQDLQNFAIAEQKCLDSLSDYPRKSLFNLFSSLVELTNQTYLEEEFKVAAFNIKISPYNKTYFVNQLLRISKINSTKFFIESNECWQLVVNHFIELTTKRKMSYKLRLFFVGIFNEIIKNVTGEGFTSKSDEKTSKTATSTLDALIRFLNALIDLGPPQELLLTNCEIEIFLSTLSTVHLLIDKYDTFYQNSWDQVFEVVNTPINFMKNEYDDKVTQEKIKLLINSAFDTLKLILDEFMSTLPSDQLQFLIETSYNYLAQVYDLNISFLSVSYFWLIGDSLKARIMELEPVDVSEMLQTVTSKQELLTKAETSNSSSYLYHITLDLYLLTTLAEVCQNDHAQVRDGAIQTFFQILELHGDILTKSGSWNILFKIALPTLLESKIVKSKDLFESLELVLTGLTSMYTKFEFDKEKWKQLIEYFQNLLSLNWIELNVEIFKTFKSLISVVKPDLHETMFRFWCGIDLEYDFINSSYQDYLTMYMSCFSDLYKLIKPVNSEQLVTIISALNKCAMYPILPRNQSDETKLSKLQQVIIENIEIIDVGENQQQEGQILQFLATVVTFPIALRQRVVSKFEEQNMIDKFNIATFNAFSHTSLRIIRQKIDYFNNVTKNDNKSLQNFVNDKTIHKLFRSLNEIVLVQLSGFDNKEWLEANEILKIVISKMMKSEEKYDEEVWQLIIQSININYKIDYDVSKAKSQTIYQALIEIVLPNFLETNNKPLISQCIEDVYEHSFLYEFNNFELDLLEENKPKKEEEKEEEIKVKEKEEKMNEIIIDRFVNYNFNDTFGTTKPVIEFPNQAIRLDCLHQLIKFCEIDHENLNEISKRILMKRVVICLRRYMSDLKLVNKCPMPQIQQRELSLILTGLIELTENKSNSKIFNKLYKLLVKLIPLVKQEKTLLQIETLLSRLEIE